MESGSAGASKHYRPLSKRKTLRRQKIRKVGQAGRLQLFGTRVRKIHTKRYDKQVPGHHIQKDVKFLTFIGKGGEKIRRFQFMAIDDATRTVITPGRNPGWYRIPDIQE